MSDPLKGAGKIGFFAEQFLKAYFRHGKGGCSEPGAKAIKNRSKPARGEGKIGIFIVKRMRGQQNGGHGKDGGQ